MNPELLLSHFNCITGVPDAIPPLRRFILELAVRGKLAQQDDSEEPAAQLLERLAKHKARLMRQGEIKQSKRLVHADRLPLPKDEMPFPIPSGWQWIRFGHIIENSEAGWSPKTESFPRSGDNWGVLKVSAVSWDRFLPEENKQLLPGVVPPERAQVRNGDFLISRANTSELVAKCVVVKDEPTNLLLSDKIVRLQIAEECCKDFYCLVNNHASYARAYYAEEASGTSHSMKNVSREVIYALAIPLPPATEQRRIVAKVGELMTLCDELEAQLLTTHAERIRLLESVLHNTLND